MRLKKKISQHRRDFDGLFECDHCGFEQTAMGYDDHNFHHNVIPAMACPDCGKTAAASTPKTSPDVPAGVTI